MKNIRKYLLVPVLCGSLWGCHTPKYSDNSTLTITPGVGIKGVIELGMTLREVRRNTRDLTVDKSRYEGFRSVFNEDGWILGFTIPSLGIICGQMKTNLPLSSITFKVGEPWEPVPPWRKSLQPFRGAVTSDTGVTLSFHRAGSVQRQDVIAAFGEPERLLDSRADSRRSGWLREIGPTVISWRENGHSFEWLVAPGVVKLFYPRRGIQFDLGSNGVELVSVVSWDGK